MDYQFKIVGINLEYINFIKRGKEMDLKLLKEMSKQKSNEAHGLYNLISTEIIRRDMCKIVEKINNEKFNISCDDGILTIIDRRGISFLWSFEVIVDNYDIRLGDAFTYDSKVSAIQLLDNNIYMNCKTEVLEILDEYDSTINLLSTNKDITKYEYHYYSCHEEIECKNIDDLCKAVLARTIQK